MATASEGDTVKVHYRGLLPDGVEFDSSHGKEPIDIEIGSGKTMAAIEQALVGMAPGETKNVDIPKDDAFGDRDPSLIQKVERARIPDEVTVEIGRRVYASSPDGKQMALTIVEADDQTVTLDANHPLAGRDLTFELQMVSIT